MEIELVELKTLNTLPDNYRIHTPEQLDFLRSRLKLRGQTRPLRINRRKVRGVDNPVIAGNGIFEAMKLEGWAKAFVQWIDLEEKEALAESLADNKAYELGGTDFPLLKETLLELDQYNIDMSLTGFQPVELENILTWTPPDIKPPEEDELNEMTQTMITIYVDEETKALYEQVMSKMEGNTQKEKFRDLLNRANG